MAFSIFRLLPFFLAVFCLLSPHVSVAQVTAEFSAPVTSGCSPLIVNFQNQSTGAGLSYQWNLGNGNSSTTQNPSASYINPGTYTVTLTVTGPGGTDTEVKTAFITVFTPPAIDISSSQTTGCFPFTVDFGDASVIGDSPVASWSWDFGDGGTSTAQNPSHTYTTAGTFGVTLLVVDANGCASNQNFPAYINSNNNRPFAGLTASLLVGCAPPVNVDFANLSFGGTGGLDYVWNFGDGETSTANNPAHAYETEGLFDVTLTVTDQLGCESVANLDAPITIVNEPVIDFSVPNTNGCLGSIVQFTDLSSPPPTSWSWNFGDGGTSAQQNPGHQYTAPGTYTVTLTAFYQGSCQATEVKTAFISIGGTPFVSFTPSQSAGCEIPFPVSFTNNSVGAGLSFMWVFGDGDTSYLTSPTHTYIENGLFTVALTATNPQGCSTTQTTNINVLETTADFVPDVFGFCRPLTVNFSDLSISGTPIVGYQWDFGDGGTSTSANPTHVYQDSGRFDVSLIITNALGCTDTLMRTDHIFAYDRPVANFDQTPFVICPGEFEFTNFSTGATDWYWDFGDQNFDVVQNPIHNYQDTGYFSVTLIALNNGCADTIVAVDMLYVVPPVASMIIDFSCSTPNQFSFTNTSLGDDTFEWSFGDGLTNSMDNTITHVYAGSGMYFVDLTVTNNASGCTDSHRDTVYVTDLNAAFTSNVTVGCAPLLVSFTNQSTDAVSYQWNFGGGASSTSAQNPNRTFSNIGTYNVRLTVTDINGCTDQLLIPNMITVSGVFVNFEVDTAFGCDTYEVQFNDLSTPTGTVASWLWDFGDGSTGSGQNPQHIYTSTGTYDVSLTVTNSLGCVNTDTLPDIVNYNPYPVPAFIVSDTLGCIGTVFAFINQSSDDAVSFVWNFGDGNTSSEMDVEHVYMQDGVYTVTLTAINVDGCDSTLVRQALINIARPDADFIAFPTFAFCPPLLVSFTDQSEDAVAWQWDFGNGNSSTIQNPSHIYTQSGIYTVRLVVTNVNGCTDTIVMPDLIELSGPSGDFTFFPDTIGCPPYAITYESNTTNATNYTWDFGDGSLGSGASTSHTYMQSGAFIPTLILQDANGCTFIYQSADTLQVAELVVSAGPDGTICANDAVQLNATGGDTYSWFPPIGLSDPAAASPIASPSVTTTYIVTVQQLACMNNDTVVVYVNPTPQAALSANDVCFGDVNQFNDLSTIAAPDSVVSWQWNLGGILSTDTDPSLVFGQAGTFDIQLIVSSSLGCSDTALAVVVVNPSPVADFSANDTCLFQPTQYVDLSTVSSGDIISWGWDFGNGATSIQQNPNVTYSQAQPYVVALVVTAAGGCTDTLVQTIEVFPIPVADFAVANVCLGDTVSFIDSSSVATGSIAQWNWIFGDGTTSTEQNPMHLYPNTQAYVFGLTVTSNNGCTHTASGAVNVHPLPISNFSMSATQTCFVPTTVNFESLSSGAVSQQWNFANGDSSTLASPSAVFTDVGQYSVQLIVANQFGCLDTSSRAFQVFPTVVADFTYGDPDGCEPWTVVFENTSVNGTGYRWDFSDLMGSVNASPTHIFEQAGTYSVTLIAQGLGGCADTVTYADIINVFANPHADFEYEQVMEPIVDGTVYFTNTSTPSYISSWWDFGDGVTDEGATASHQYDAYGNKLVTLAIMDANGCVDTLSRYVPVEFFGTLFVPNAVMVGHSDPEASLFLPKGRGLLRYRCAIFDKWGNKLWETTELINGSPAEGWNGTYRGEVVPQGSYVWKIDAVFTNSSVWEGQEHDGVRHQAGSVTVLR